MPSTPRIVYHPLIIGMDGKLLPLKHLPYATLLLDPGKFDANGVKQAADYARTKTLVDQLKVLFTKPEDVITRVFRSMVKPDFADFILPKTLAVREYPSRLEDVLTASADVILNGFREQSDQAFRMIDQQRKHVAPRDEKLRRDLFTASPEAKFGIIPSLTDSYYPEKDHQVVEQAENTTASIKRSLGRMPGFLRSATQNEPLTIAVVEHIFDADRRIVQGTSIAGANAILLSDVGVKGNLDNVLKEELLHYFDVKMKFTSQKEFTAAADSLLSDQHKATRLEDALQTMVHKHNKQPLRSYAKERQPMELLVDYFHLREALEKKAGRVGCVPVPTAGLFSKQAAAAIDKQLTELFGDEVHMLCRQFELELTARQPHLVQRQR